MNLMFISGLFTPSPQTPHPTLASAELALTEFALIESQHEHGEAVIFDLKSQSSFLIYILFKFTMPVLPLYNMMKTRSLVEPPESVGSG